MTLPWYPRDMGKYARDTKHLTLTEHGAYNLMLDCYYSTGSLPQVSNALSNASLMPDHSRIYRLCSAMTKQEQDAVDSVLKMFFSLNNDGFYTHFKADKVIKEQEEKHRRRVEAGRLGGKSNGKSNASSNASSNTPQKEKETKTKNNILYTPISPIELDMNFQSFWNLYPGRGKNGAIGNGYKGSKQDALKEFEKRINETKVSEREELFRDIENGCREYQGHLDRSGYPSKHARTWLHGFGWKDDYGSTKGQSERTSKHSRAKSIMLGQEPDYIEG